MVVNGHKSGPGFAVYHTYDNSSHSSQVLSQWTSFTQHSNSQAEEVVIDGHNLDIAMVVAIARYGGLARLDESTSHEITLSARLLQSSLDQGDVIYGVNTGFGGSADTRTNKTEELQATLIRELHSGILSNPFQDSQRTCDVLPCEDVDTNTCMPEAWARASILVRINSLATGHSGVRPLLINRMLDLLKKDIIPRIPLRGSISASGDLMPLSYIGGTLEGKRNLTVWTGSRSNRRVVTADVALADSSLDPVILGPKEGLAIINGTAVSTGVAALAIHDANMIAVLSQLLTAMSVEALRGTDESFDPLFAAIRPHPGQIEAARNIRSFLAGSTLVQRKDGLEGGTLRQDRYSIRTAPQWVGPILEDLRLASQQITIECNSVTDNPLIDIDSHRTTDVRILHGGNFQAKAVTSAMEKVRLAMQTVGQMLFAQCTEIINPRLNYGLPPSLAVDEPSQSFLLKPVDIMIAALQSELGFLSNPAGNHVQSAEMGNQALNSLGLISARYTHTALDVLSQLAAAHLFTLCQALDIRAMNLRFLEAVEPALRSITSETVADLLDENVASSAVTSEVSPSQHLKPSLADVEARGESNGTNDVAQNDNPLNSTPSIRVPPSNPSSHPHHHPSAPSPPPPPNPPSNSNPRLETLHNLLWTAFTTHLDQTTTLDSPHRFTQIFQSLQSTILNHASPSHPNTVSLLRTWTSQSSASALEIYLRNRDAYAACPHASPVLGRASGRMYKYVREELGVPFLRTEMVRAECGLTTGGLITSIYQAIRTGGLYGTVMECLSEVEDKGR